MRIKRRQMLQGFVATGALLLAAPARAATRRGRAVTDPEPLQHFAGFAEGFYGAGEHVYYIDEQQMGWAPPNLDRSQLAPATLEPTGRWSLLSLLTRLRKRRWAWTVEHAVLLRLRTDRALAADLLATALDIDRQSPSPSAARLHHLQLALDDASRTRPWRSTTTGGGAFATLLRA
jgi:hypothetical protein